MFFSWYTCFFEKNIKGTRIRHVCVFLMLPEAFMKVHHEGFYFENLTDQICCSMTDLWFKVTQSRKKVLFFNFNQVSIFCSLEIHWEERPHKLGSKHSLKSKLTEKMFTGFY